MMREKSELLTNHDTKRYKMEQSDVLDFKKVFLLVSLNKISFSITNLLAF